MFRLFHNATVHAMNPATGWTPQAQWHSHDMPHPDAILTSDDRIVAVGDYQRLKDLAPLGTERTDLGGTYVLPGMGDGHIHSAMYSRSLIEPDMRHCTSLESALEVLRPFVERGMADDSITWIFGGQWNVNAWDVPELPDRHALDTVAPHIPVALGSLDWHTLWLNSKALQELGLDRNVKDPDGGEFVRDEHGELTGVIREAAAIPIRDGLMQSDVSGNIDDYLPLGQRELLKRGITSIHDIDGADCLYAYQKLRERGELDIRIHKVLRQEQVHDFIRRGIRTASGDEWISIGPLKLFADGALGSHTCHMSEAWPGTENHGMTVTSPQELEHWIGLAASAGIATAVHAIGDQATTEVLDAFAKSQSIARVFGLRQRVEHAQYMKRSDVPRFRELGVTASMQPMHCTADIPMNDFLAERDLVAYGWNSLREAGAELVFGSDGPVEDPNPFRGIHAAITRTRDGAPEGGWQPHERLPRAETVYYYTHAVARASYEENLKGCLAPGMLADFVSVDRDIFSEDAEAVKDTVVEATVVGAQIRYQRED
ncbi:amidohydrolase family protein [Kocuria indica]|uniref:Amidohydrolase family protein n=1 Tax=Kocuria marina subsp. indica TaxID=1049583 RepID=A0A6N9QZY4_9MICC|nr:MULTISPECIES: amidohydrolase [Kocuria]MCT1616507.1 amidohydrolase [Kocuria marina]NDO78008.1 amidohydrolase family protein [Kocuria indica]